MWVDDQPQFVLSVAAVIEGLHDELLLCTSVEAAWSCIRDRAPDLVLVDLRMPPGEWGGLELLRLSGENLARCPHVVVSGVGSLRECVEAVRLGAADYIEKERVTEELPAVVLRVIRDFTLRRPAYDYQLVRDLETRVHRLVIDGLQRLAAEQKNPELFQALVPREIAIKTYQRLLDEGTGRQEDFLDLLDLAKILQRHWQALPEARELEGLLRPRRTADRVAWLEELNEMRRVVAHPVRGELTASQRSRLTELSDLVARWETNSGS